MPEFIVVSALIKDWIIYQSKRVKQVTYEYLKDSITFARYQTTSGYWNKRTTQEKTKTQGMLSTNFNNADEEKQQLQNEIILIGLDVILWS